MKRHEFLWIAKRNWNRIDIGMRTSGNACAWSAMLTTQIKAHNSLSLPYQNQKIVLSNVFAEIEKKLV